MHFEDLWQEAERKTKDIPYGDAVMSLQETVEVYDDEKIGDLLLDLAVISREKNIDVFLALKEAVDRHLIEADVANE